MEKMTTRVARIDLYFKNGFVYNINNVVSYNYDIRHNGRMNFDIKFGTKIDILKLLNNANIDKIAVLYEYVNIDDICKLQKEEELFKFNECYINSVKYENNHTHNDVTKIYIVGNLKNE